MPTAADSWTARRRMERALLVVVAAGAPVGVAAALAPVRDRLAPPTVALLLVLVVVTLAVVTGRRYGALLAAGSAAIGFDYFHTLPYGSLSIHRSEDVQTALLLLVTAAVVGELAAWGRRDRDATIVYSEDLARLAAVSAMVGEGVPVDTVVLAVAHELAEVLSLRDCRFDPSPPTRPVARIDPAGEVLHAGVRWPADTAGLPGSEVDLPVHWEGGAVGHFLLTPTPGAAVPLRRMQTALVLAGCVAPTLVAPRHER